jgi:hypothetical protein
LSGGEFSDELESTWVAPAAEAKSALMSSSFAQRRDVDEPYSHSEWRLAQLEQDGRASSHCWWYQVSDIEICSFSYLHSSPFTFHTAMAGFPMWSSERHVMQLQPFSAELRLWGNFGSLHKAGQATGFDIVYDYVTEPCRSNIEQKACLI